MKRLSSVPSNDEIREKLISCAGHSPRNPDKTLAEVAVEILLPRDELAWARFYLTTKLADGSYPSNCGLFGGYFYQGAVLGMSTKNIDNPYKGQISQAYSDIEENAREYGAWARAKTEIALPPECGDIYAIGEGGTGHIVNVVEFVGDAESGIVSSVDGGQVDNTWIMERNRQWTVDRQGRAWIGTRLVTGVQRIGALRANALALQKNIG